MFDDSMEEDAPFVCAGGMSDIRIDEIQSFLNDSILEMGGSAEYRSINGWKKHPPRVSECNQSLTAHQHRKGHTVPKQVILIATSIQVATV